VPLRRFFFAMSNWDRNCWNAFQTALCQSADEEPSLRRDDCDLIPLRCASQIRCVGMKDEKQKFRRLAF
jgi:hypothetical protein